MQKRVLAMLLALSLVALCGCVDTTSSAPQTPSLPQSETQSAPEIETSSNWQEEIEQTIMLSSYHPAPAPNDDVRTWYEVFVYSYCDSNGDGIGDLQGLTSKLDYISYMGFNGIWLMPIHPSPTYHKYDVSDYYAIDPQYGTLEDFDVFMEECERRGIRVILDLVLNHTSVQHPWFKQAVRALRDGELDNQYIEYYNFEQRAAGGSWYTAAGDWCYEAMFWSGMPDLNFESEALWSDIADITEFWFDRGVAGFRLDAVKEFESGNATANIEILQRLNGLVKQQKSDAYLVGENWDTSDAVYQYYQSGIDSLFDYPFATQSGYIAQTLLSGSRDATFFAQKMLAAQQLIKQNNPGGSDAPFFINHDNARASGFLRRDASLIKTAWGMNLMMSGNAFVYYGEELGMSGSGRDENKRAPMYWTDDAMAQGMTYGPPEMEHTEHSFEPAMAQLKDGDSILKYIQRAISIRNAYPAIARGEMAILQNSGSSDVAVVEKTWQGERVVLVYNLTSEMRTVKPMPGDADWPQLVDWLCASGGEASFGADGLTLPPYTIAVLA